MGLNNHECLETDYRELVSERVGSRRETYMFLPFDKNKVELSPLRRGFLRHTNLGLRSLSLLILIFYQWRSSQNPPRVRVRVANERQLTVPTVHVSSRTRHYSSLP